MNIDTVSDQLQASIMQKKYEQYGLHVQVPKRFDHTVSGMFGECERMGYYAHGLGLVPKAENYAFTWGRVYHKITELWNRTKDRGTATNDITDVIVQHIPENVVDRYNRTRSRMLELFVAWADYSEKTPLKVLQNEQPVFLACLDDPCPYSDHGCGLAYGGRLDVIADWNGIVGPLDRKTSVMDDADPVAEYKPSHQMEGYNWLASHLMGQHCWGVILEKAVCNKSKIKIGRYPISYSKDMIREWVTNEIKRQRRIVAKLESPAAYVMEDFDQNHFRCYKPFKCAYRDICTSPRDMDFRLKLMRDQYVEARWDFENPDQRDTMVQEAV